MRSKGSAIAACLWLLAFALLLGACGPANVTREQLEAAGEACERAGTCDGWRWDR
jgi:hypothetical protein